MRSFRATYVTREADKVGLRFEDFICDDWFVANKQAAECRRVGERLIDVKSIDVHTAINTAHG